MSDLISRQQAMDAIYDWHPKEDEPWDKFDKQVAFTVINALLSEQVTGDTISRQQAINTANTMRKRCDTDSIDDYHDVLIEALEVLPSAQTEQRWVPVSERLPEDNGRYLITGIRGTVYPLGFKDGRWYGGIKPVAWLRLPEPYKGDE